MSPFYIFGTCLVGLFLLAAVVSLADSVASLIAADRKGRRNDLHKTPPQEGSVSDWQQQRRNYLFSQGMRQACRNMSGIMTVALGVMGVGCLLLGLDAVLIHAIDASAQGGGDNVVPAQLFYLPFYAPFMAGLPSNGQATGWYFILAMASIFAAVSLYGWQKSAAQAQPQPYVPPVEAGNIPVDQVLVRGAEAPAATSDALLRPTASESPTRAEELLRPPQENTVAAEWFERGEGVGTSLHFGEGKP